MVAAGAFDLLAADGALQAFQAWPTFALGEVLAAASTEAHV
jgi:hypothetical protein